MQHIPGLYIGESPSKGRGVFTAHPVSHSDVIEICPVILIPKDQLGLIHQTVLHDYYFLWPGDEGISCLALGYGSIYNHASRPNAAITFDLDEMTIIVTALRDIEAFEEIFIDYQGDVKGAPKLWFDVK